MSNLPVHYKDFKSLLKTLLSPSGDNHSTTMNETPDIEQARHPELGHRYRQQQQCRGDEGTNSITCQQHAILLTITKVAIAILNLHLPQNPSRRVVLPDLYPLVIDLHKMHVSNQHVIEPGGILDINDLQASDSAYQVAPEIDYIYSYVTRKQYSRIKRAWKDIVFAIKSDNSSLEEELAIRLEQQCQAYCKSEAIPGNTMTMNKGLMNCY